MSRRWWRRGWAEAVLLPVVLAAVRVCQATVIRLPFSWWQSWLGCRQRSPRLDPRRDRRRLASLVWMLKAQDRLPPRRGRCLAEALVALVALRILGLDGRTHLGLTRQGGGLSAHAWVRSGDLLVCGARLHRRFQPLPGRW